MVVGVGGWWGWEGGGGVCGGGGRMPSSAELYILHLHVPVNVVLSQRQNGCFRAVFSGSIFLSCSNLHLKEGSQLNSNCSEMTFYRIEF